MSNLAIFSILALVVMNIILWILVFSKSRSEEDIIVAIGEALKRGEDYNGEVAYYPSNKAICLLESIKKKDFVATARLTDSRINALCNYLNVKIKTQDPRPAACVVVKKGGKK